MARTLKMQMTQGVTDVKNFNSRELSNTSFTQRKIGKRQKKIQDLDRNSKVKYLNPPSALKSLGRPTVDTSKGTDRFGSTAGWMSFGSSRKTACKALLSSSGEARTASSLRKTSDDSPRALRLSATAVRSPGTENIVSLALKEEGCDTC